MSKKNSKKRIVVSGKPDAIVSVETTELAVLETNEEVLETSTEIEEVLEANANEEVLEVSTEIEEGSTTELDENVSDALITASEEVAKGKTTSNKKSVYEVLTDGIIQVVTEKIPTVSAIVVTPNMSFHIGWDPLINYLATCLPEKSETGAFEAKEIEKLIYHHTSVELQKVMTKIKVLPVKMGVAGKKEIIEAYPEFPELVGKKVGDNFKEGKQGYLAVKNSVFYNQIFKMQFKAPSTVDFTLFKIPKTTKFCLISSALLKDMKKHNFVKFPITAAF